MRLFRRARPGLGRRLVLRFQTRLYLTLGSACHLSISSCMHISPLVQPAVHVDRYGVVHRLDHGHLARDGDGHARGRDQANYLRDTLGIGRHAFHQQSLSVSGCSATAMEYDVFTHLRVSRPFAFTHTPVGPVPRYSLAYRRCRKLEISPHHLMSGWSVS